MSKTIEEIKMQYSKERSRNGWPLIMLQDTFNCKQMDEVAERYAQSQTQELQEQNAELVEMLKHLYELTEYFDEWEEERQNMKRLLNKHNHLKSNTNGN